MTQRKQRPTIQNFFSNLEESRLSWSWGDTKADVIVPELTGALADSKGRNVFALAGRANNHPTHLLGFAPSGAELFRVGSPPGFTFSYLTHHPLAPIAWWLAGKLSQTVFPTGTFPSVRQGCSSNWPPLTERCAGREHLVCMVMK